MLDYSLILFGSLSWTTIFYIFCISVRPHLNTSDIKQTRRRCVVFVRAVLIFIYTIYLIIHQELYDNQDPYNERKVRYVSLTFYCFDIFNLIFYVKSKDVAMYCHHILSLGILGGIIYYDILPFYFKYEMMNVEISAIFQSSKDILRSLDRAKTKITIFLEYCFTVSLILSKIVARIPMLYYNLFVIEADVILKVMAIGMQFVFFYWGWKTWQSYQEKVKQGYLSLQHFSTYPWISMSEKTD